MPKKNNILNQGPEIKQIHKRTQNATVQKNVQLLSKGYFYPKMSYPMNGFLTKILKYDRQ